MWPAIGLVKTCSRTAALRDSLQAVVDRQWMQQYRQAVDGARSRRPFGHHGNRIDGFILFYLWTSIDLDYSKLCFESSKGSLG